MSNVKMLGEIYKCNICGNIVEVLFVGGGELVCCGQPMEKLSEKVSDEGQEKHLPVINEIKTGVKVFIGSIPHPMEKEHYIMWIEVWCKNGSIARKYLKAGDAPEAEFNHQKSEILFVREVCNVHGLWKKNK